MTVSRRTVIGGAAATGLSLAGAGWAGSPAAAAPASAARRARVPGPLVPDPAGLVALPPGFTYRLVSVAGQTSLVSGEKSPDRPDGTGAFRWRDRVRLVQNHE
jgi:uncharacterized protein